MNLQKISEAKTKMEIMYDAIYELQEAIISKNEIDIKNATESFRIKAKELYFTLIFSISSTKKKNDINRTIYMDMLPHLIHKCSGISMEDALINKHNKELVYLIPRNLHMSLLNKTFGISFQKCGDIYNKNSATVMNSVKTIRNFFQTDSDFREKYNDVFQHCIEFDHFMNSTKTIDYLNEKSK